MKTITLDAGRLRHRIEIIYPVIAGQDSDTGEITTEWETFANVWADVQPYSTNEFHLAGNDQSQISARIIIRYRSGIGSEMRIVYRGKTYEIVGTPLPDKETGLEYLTLMIAELTNA